MSKRRPMGIGNIAGLIAVLATKAPPHQFLYEYTRNAFQAIQRRLKNEPGSPAQVIWGASRWFADYFGKEVPNAINKLSVLDTGDGFPPFQMETLVGDIASSVSAIGLHDSFGSGAKISALARNQEGIAFFSWRCGIGYMAILSWKNGKSITDAELIPLGGDDEVVVEVASAVGSGDMPEAIAQAGGTGTLVVFLGSVEGEKTIQVHDEKGAVRVKEIARRLTSRFLRIPEGIVLKAPEDASGFLPGTVPDFLTSMTKEDTNTGLICEISTPQSAQIQVWHSPNQHKRSGRAPSIGGIRWVFRDEVYEISPPKGNSAYLGGFGICGLRGETCVLIDVTSCVEAHPGIQRETILDETTRGEIRDWFVTNMPEELTELLNSASSHAENDSKDLHDAMQKTLREFNNIIQPKPLVTHPHGIIEVSKTEAPPNSPDALTRPFSEITVPVKDSGDPADSPEPNPNPDPIHEKRGRRAAIRQSIKRGIGPFEQLKQRAASDEPPQVVPDDEDATCEYPALRINTAPNEKIKIVVKRLHPAYTRPLKQLKTEFLLMNVPAQVLYDAYWRAFCERVQLVVSYHLGRPSADVQKIDVALGAEFDSYLGPAALDILARARLILRGTAKPAAKKVAM